MRFRPSCRNNRIVFGYCKKIFQNIFVIVIIILNKKPISVAAQSKSWVRACSLAGTAGSNPAVRHWYVFVVTVLCFHVEVFATS